MSGENVEGWLRRAAAVLAQAGMDEPRLEARILLAEAAGLSPEALLAHRGTPLAADAARRAESMLERRRRREPAAQILGRREFWHLDFEVTGDVLDPRPDSETLVASALRQLHGNRAGALRVLDLGTGTGCLLLAILTELPNAHGLGTDISPAALRVGQANATRLGLAGRTRFVAADWGRGLAGEWDVILSNPPYIRTGEIGRLQPEVAEWEPRLALDGGADGLEAYRRLAPDLARLLHPLGSASVEIGPEQAGAVVKIVEAAGLRARECARDLAGRDRCLVLARALR